MSKDLVTVEMLTNQDVSVDPTKPYTPVISDSYLAKLSNKTTRLKDSILCAGAGVGFLGGMGAVFLANPTADSNWFAILGSALAIATTSFASGSLLSDRATKSINRRYQQLSQVNRDTLSRWLLERYQITGVNDSHLDHMLSNRGNRLAFNSDSGKHTFIKAEDGTYFVSEHVPYVEPEFHDLLSIPVLEAASVDVPESLQNLASSIDRTVVKLKSCDLAVEQSQEIAVCTQEAEKAISLARQVLKLDADADLGSMVSTLEGVQYQVDGVLQNVITDLMSFASTQEQFISSRRAVSNLSF
jgi:hypothetical protein